MIKDLQDSKRIDHHIHEHSQVPMHATIVSRLFWPSFQQAPLKLPPQLGRSVHVQHIQFVSWTYILDVGFNPSTSRRSSVSNPTRNCDGSLSSARSMSPSSSPTALSLWMRLPSRRRYSSCLARKVRLVFLE
jgi:hypothetical protein